MKNSQSEDAQGAKQIIPASPPDPHRKPERPVKTQVMQGDVSVDSALSMKQGDIYRPFEKFLGFFVPDRRALPPDHRQREAHLRMYRKLRRCRQDRLPFSEPHRGRYRSG